MQTFCVTGAASGLGKAVVDKLADNRVIAIDQHSVEIAADLSNPDGRTSAITSALELSDGVLAGLVPCAGLGPQHLSERIVAVNYFGAVAMLDGLAPALVASGTGAAVLICSNATTLTPGADSDLAKACAAGDEGAALAIASDTHPAVAYAASKVALAKKMRSLVMELGSKGVRINAVAPGPFKSPLLQEGLDDPQTKDLIAALPIPLGRFGEPEEIADVIVWLLGDRARYVHGSTIFVDGGIDALLAPNRFP